MKAARAQADEAEEEALAANTLALLSAAMSSTVTTMGTINTMGNAPLVGMRDNSKQSIPLSTKPNKLTSLSIQH